MTDFELMTSGKFYNPTEKSIVLARTHARWLADKFNRTKAWNIPRRNWLIHRLIKNHGKNFFFEPTIHLEYGKNITFGDNFFMNFDCQLLDVAPIIIGDDVMFGPRVVVATPMHPLVAEERKAQQYDSGFHDLEYAKPVKIGNNVWVASNVTICGGVVIGDDVVIAAGSVVTRDIPSGVIAAGVPCKAIRAITDADRMYPEKTYKAEKAKN
ncbi:MAG: sugar O-acetyltransferase [Clostridia bacterium]